MLYLFTDKNQVKLLFQKKTMLGQYESAFYEKTHQLNLTDKGEITSMDFFASAIREALTVVSPAAVKEKEINLILPQEAFAYLRAEVPADIANSAITAFIKDKARAHLAVDTETGFSDFTIHENEKGKQVLFYAISNETVKKYQDAFNLLGLQIVNIIPEPLAYFKLFEKTLRKDKKEYIMYASYENERIKGYLYDTYGPLEEKKIDHKVTSTTSVEHLVKKVADELEVSGKKLNRLILSGQSSETIRQDTFTKDVGVWTNPLKRIIPQFYEDYLKILVTSPNTSLPFLLYDVCIGAFIFSLENKQFSLLRKGSNKGSSTSSSRPRPTAKFRFPIKEIALFVGSFGLSFILLMFFMKFNGQKSILQETNKPTAIVKPTEVPPTSTPTPSVNRKDIKIKLLNGSGAKGKASEIKDLLKEKGYVDVLTGNADNFDYKKTELQVKSDNRALDSLIKGDLKDNVSAPKMTKLDKDSPADIVIIFGEDFK